MATFAQPSLTNSQLLALPAETRLRPRHGVIHRLVSTLRAWRETLRQRAALAELSERELADFGATTADVYRELATPYWRIRPRR